MDTIPGPDVMVLHLPVSLVISYFLGLLGVVVQQIAGRPNPLPIDQIFLICRTIGNDVGMAVKALIKERSDG